MFVNIVMVINKILFEQIKFQMFVNDTDEYMYINPGKNPCTKLTFSIIYIYYTYMYINT